MGTLSVQAENYLKAIWNAAEWSDKPVSTGTLAARLEVAPSSATEAVKKLVDAGLVSHARYGAVELTDEGRVAALQMVRKHRLIETFLVEYLGYSWDLVHVEAEVLEHAVSDHFVEQLADRLGQPLRDPHGDPIPLADGTLPPMTAVLLADAEVGVALRVAQVSDDDSALLRYLGGLGIGLDSEVVVSARQDAAGTLTLAHGAAETTIGAAAARAVRVEPLAASA